VQTIEPPMINMQVDRGAHSRTVCWAERVRVWWVECQRIGSSLTIVEDFISSCEETIYSTM
jgi:hypothetical protein